MSHPSAQPGVQRQITLPLSKAVEIAYKSIRLRLSRSLLVTSGIVLALAFLMSIRVNESLTTAMRTWAEQRHAELDRKVDAAEKKAGGASADLNPLMQELKEIENLQQIMMQKGVPVTLEDIAADRIQVDWLLGLALMVAFMGILNSMLMSVTERFREIGTMKCLGALDGFIVKLFLLESLFQGIVGTTLGVVLGLVLSFAGSYANYGSFAFKNLPVGQILYSTGLCVLVGIGLTVAAAVYPAWQAARMQPIEAMRVEA
jgi:putative ABC transport system permease protein